MHKKFLKILIASIGICILLVTLCYFFLDKPIAFAMAKIPRYPFLKGMNQIAMGVRVFAILLLVGLGIKSLLRPLSKTQGHLLLFALTTTAAIYIKDWLKVIFGRYWPATWANDNPSLLKGNAFGFNFWKWDYDVYGSFPSGHILVVFCALTFFWKLAPRWRMVAVLIGACQTLALLGLNYHFLGDIVAGAFLGSLCALIAIRIYTNQEVLAKTNSHR